jgi:hypothetical protein
MLAQTNANYSCTFLLKNKSTNTPYDLTNKRFKMQLKNAPGSAFALEASTDNGRLSNGADPTLGKLLFSVNKTVMQALKPDTYFFDNLELVDADNDYLICRGLWRVYAGLTDDLTPDLPVIPGSAVHADSMTIIVGASEIAVSIVGAAAPVLGLIQSFSGPPSTPAFGGQWYYDTDDNTLKFIFSNGLIWIGPSNVPAPT